MLIILAFCPLIRIFAATMNKEQKETVRVRVVSCIFVVLALAIFKPFGLGAWQWQVYVHLLAIFSLGLFSCLVTDCILKYLVRMPRSTVQGVDYIIRRNLFFQFINTPLVALLICLYRHFVMSDLIESNKFSVSNFLETLAIIAFLSFAIGLYWRFKFRSKFLEAELEETKMLNEQLKRLQAYPDPRQDEIAETQNDASSSNQAFSPVREVGIEAITLTGTTNETVTLKLSDLLYIEAVGNYVKVCQFRDGQVRTDMLRATSKQMEDELRDYPMIVRCHRAFLVNLGQVERIIAKSGSMQLVVKHSHDTLPVSRSNMTQVKEALCHHK